MGYFTFDPGSSSKEHPLEDPTASSSARLFVDLALVAPVWGANVVLPPRSPAVAKRLESKNEVLGTPSWELAYTTFQKGTFESMIFLFPRWDMDSFPRGYLKFMGILDLQVVFFLCPSWMSIYPLVVVGKTRLFRPF